MSVHGRILLVFVVITTLVNFYYATQCYHLRNAEICLITKVFHCETIINGKYEFRCHLGIICSDGEEFRDIVDTDTIPASNNYVYWDNEEVAANKIHSNQLITIAILICLMIGLLIQPW